MSVVVDETKSGRTKAEKVDKVDFKMVSFSLAGKDYGIDIMKVKEISKAGKFTHVPNAAPYVRGVYNLRGDIISIIDLRIMFHLPAERKGHDALENIIILRIEDSILGIIVDSIEKVIGIASSSIQPPHPLFGDINIRYINGVVEYNSRLYLILDVDAIFGTGEKTRLVEETRKEIEERESDITVEKGYSDNVNFDFVTETLGAFAGFHLSEVNLNWLRERFGRWEKERTQRKQDVQLRDAADAETFLIPFYSPCSGILWGAEYEKAVYSLLPEKADSLNFMVWNAGCGKGAESYSLACLLRRKYPDNRLKIWANDNDLLSIAAAPAVVFQEVPPNLLDFSLQGKNGYGFVSEIKDLIHFEYHDILNPNPYPEVDLIVARDVLSFLKPVDQSRLLLEFEEKLKMGGLLIIGANEEITGTHWSAIEQDGIKGYKKVK